MKAEFPHLTPTQVPLDKLSKQTNQEMSEFVRQSMLAAFEFGFYCSEQGIGLIDATMRFNATILKQSR